ncbi:hypothetical protein GCM10023223_48090 [Stackebrandtia albiflava]
MREVWAKLYPESFFEFGFPYSGELSYGWRTGLMDTSTLMQVVDELNRRGLPLTREESEICLLLSEDIDSARGFAADLRRHETGESGDVWQYYVCVTIVSAVAHLPTRFDLLDSAWADLDYPEGMRELIYPEGDLPSHLHVSAGSRALSEFMDAWQKRLSGRMPSNRVPNIELLRKGVHLPSRRSGSAARYRSCRGSEWHRRT